MRTAKGEMDFAHALPRRMIVLYEQLTGEEMRQQLEKKIPFLPNEMLLKT